MNTTHPPEALGFTGADAARRITQREDKKMSNVTMKVSIPVTLLEDDVDPETRDCEVTYDNDTVVLHADGGGISFKQADLVAALALLRKPAHPPYGQMR